MLNVNMVPVFSAKEEVEFVGALWRIMVNMLVERVKYEFNVLIWKKIMKL